MSLRAWWRGARSALDELAPRVDACSWDEAIARGWSPNRGGEYCGRCGATMGQTGMTPDGCAFCRDQRLPWHALVRLGAYEPPLAEWIRAMKFGGRWTWAHRFGRELAIPVGEHCADHAEKDKRRTAVCPVPMHWRRRWARGFNQAHLMAEAMAAARSWPMVELLKRSRWTTPQVHVPFSQRQDNIRRSFKSRGLDLAGWDIWLVDDIKTSGATLSACARLLRERGAQRVLVAVAAVADPRGSGFTRI